MLHLFIYCLTHFRDLLQELFAIKLYLNKMSNICFACLQRAQLTEVILKLLGAWRGPLSQLYWSMSQDQNQDFNVNGSNKALEISGMVHELRDGVAKMTEKVGIHMIMLNLWTYLTVTVFTWVCKIFPGLQNNIISNF